MDSILVASSTSSSNIEAASQFKQELDEQVRRFSSSDRLINRYFHMRALDDTRHIYQRLYHASMIFESCFKKAIICLRTPNERGEMIQSHGGFTFRTTVTHIPYQDAYEITEEGVKHTVALAQAREANGITILPFSFA